MSLVTWLRGIARGISSTGENGNTDASNGLCGRSESAFSRRTPAKVGDDVAERLLAQAAALTEVLDAEGTPYAVVGGMAVLAQARNAGCTEFRATYDIDIMVEDQRSFSALATKRGEIAALEGVQSPDVEEELAQLEAAEGDNESISPALGPHGTFAVGIDSVVSLNGFTLDTLETETLAIGERRITVATCEQLIQMKESTLSLLGASPAETSRPQDYIDLAILRKLVREKAREPRFEAAEREKEEGGRRTDVFGSNLRAGLRDSAPRPRR